MTNLLVAIIGVAIFVMIVVVGALWLGPELQKMKAESDAARLITQREQIVHAIELRHANTGVSIPDVPLTLILDTLVTEQYLKTIPMGLGTPWSMSEDGYAYTHIGTDSYGLAVCRAARRRLGIPNPDTILSCTDPSINTIDPCCMDN